MAGDVSTLCPMVNNEHLVYRSRISALRRPCTLVLSAGIVGSVNSFCFNRERVDPGLQRLLDCVHDRYETAQVSLNTTKIYCQLKLARLSLGQGGNIGCDRFHGCKDTIYGLVAYKRSRFT